METTEQPTSREGEVVLDRYELCERIGAGGFGTVWLAHDQRLDREVAVKRIPIHGGAAARAEREAKAAARLSHPAIVSLFEAGRDKDAVYLVSELVRGDTLGALQAEGALSDRDVLRIGVALCDALAHAHARGVVHRDVKPGNVLVPDSVADGIVAKLTDFGIARMAGDDALTATGDVVGTLAYMAPEQAEGKSATAASDLYALALVIYEALSGVNPIRQAGAAATARKLGTRLPPLRRLRRDLPRDLCAALDAAVMPDPAMRGSIPTLRGVLAAAIGDADDEPGTVDGSLWEDLAPQTLLSRTVYGREPRDLSAPPSTSFGPRLDDDEADLLDGALLTPVRISITGRVASALLTGGLVAALLPFATSGPALDRLVAGAVAAAAVALLPRLGWLAAVTALIVWLLADGAQGPALVVAAAALPVVVVAPRVPAWWSAPGIAIVLGMAGVGGAWPAIAGQCRGLVARAGLGALGFWWLALAETVRDERLLTGPAGASKAGLDEAADAIASIVTAGTLGIAALWAVGAAVLPMLVRGRNVALDLLAAVVWTVGLALGARAIADAAGAGTPRGLAAAAALAALAAVVARAFSRRP